MSSSSRLSEASQSGLTLSSLAASLPQPISYYPQQNVVPIGVQSQQQQVIYGGGMASTGTSASSNMQLVPQQQQQAPQQAEMRPTDAQTTAQGTVYPKRIFVGGIPAQTTEADLKLYFSQYGSVTETKIIQDRAGVSKGYGFVTFESADEVNKILAKDQQETLIFKDRKLNLGPAIRKNQLTQSGQPSSAPAIMYLPNSVPINGEGGQTFMLVPPMQMGDGNYGSYQTALPMIASAGGQAIYFQQPTYLMPQQQIASNAINAIQVPSFQTQPQQHQIQQATAALTTPHHQQQQQQTYQYRATPQTPPTPGGYPLTPVNCHYTPGGPTSTSDFYGADYEPIHSHASAEDNTSTWGSLTWGSQVANYSAASDLSAPTAGLNLNRELDVAADPFTIPDVPSSTVHEIKQEPSGAAGVKSSGSGYVSSTSSNVSLYNSVNGAGGNNNNNGNQNGDSVQNETFSGSFHKAGSVNGGITGPDWSNF